MAFLELKNINYKYPTSEDWVVRNIDMKIEKGEFWAIVGKNGSGKTTLCNIMRGFAPSFFKGTFEGEVIVDNKDLNDYSEGEKATKIGFVFQNPFVQISGVKETVYDEIAFGLENLGLEEQYIRNKVEETLKLIDIDYLRNKNPFELSGGQRQRVALASIIAMDPDILVIDEPTSQLDPDGTEKVFEIIETMKNKGKTIILVEHKIELIAEYADNIIVLDEGEIILRGETKDILKNKVLLEKEIGIPQYSILGYELRDRGFIIDIPTTEEQSINIISNIMQKKVIV
jgi:energy-coupling factor transport system ATP-binding protein